MKIIDKSTGKRVDGLSADAKNIKKELKEKDPIIVNATKDADAEYSPMDPPDAYSEEHCLGADYNNMSEGIKVFMDDHSESIAIISEFEDALKRFKESGFYITKEINRSFNSFFVHFDEVILPHNRLEEKHLFPVLHNRLLEAGEHSPGNKKQTAVNLMEDDHVKFIQLASLCFNMLGLGMRLPDKQAMAITFDLAFNTGMELVEILKLHIYREDNTLFPLAQQLFSEQELSALYARLKAEETDN